MSLQFTSDGYHAAFRKNHDPLSAIFSVMIMGLES